MTKPPPNPFPEKAQHDHGFSKHENDRSGQGGRQAHHFTLLPLPIPLSKAQKTMKFTATATMFASLLSSASAFGVRRQHAAVRRAFTTATQPRNMANVLRLTEPQSQLLDEVDVFIFDCDGVIWRVSDTNETKQARSFFFFSYSMLTLSCIYLLKNPS